ncbi:MAG TPA: hypothetical protein VI056_11800 [Candidatus Limnocylindria bacterium]
MADTTATSVAVGDAAWSWVGVAIEVGAELAVASGLASAGGAGAVALVTTAAVGALLADEVVVFAAAPPEQAATSSPKRAATMPAFIGVRVFLIIISLRPPLETLPTPSDEPLFPPARNLTIV